MIRVDADDRGFVIWIEFEKTVEPVRGQYALGEVNHEEIAAEIAQSERAVASILIEAFPLKAELTDDPRYARRTNHILASEVEEYAARRMTNRYLPEEEVLGFYRARGTPLWKNNFDPPGDERDREYVNELLRLFWAAQEKALFPEIVEEERETERYEFDEATGAERERSPQEFAAAWERRQLEVFLPRVASAYERIYAIAPPLCHWDERNRFQQWFFIDMSDRIAYAVGGSASSGQREAMGRYAHVFAVLAERYHREAPTHFLEYTEANEVKLVSRFPDFKALSRELTGNYAADSTKVETLFRGRLIQPRG